MRQGFISKITQPSAAGTFPRHRLFRLINKKPARPILWITGPPGSGKTTLVSSYLETYGYPCLWYQLDANDRDIANFFYYMGLAAKKVAPRKRPIFPLFTPEYLKDISTFTRRYFERLYDFLLNLLTDSLTRFVIAFDNYQDVPRDCLLHEVIHLGVSEVPEGIHILVMSRHDPPDLFA